MYIKRKEIPLSSPQIPKSRQRGSTDPASLWNSLMGHIGSFCISCSPLKQTLLMKNCEELADFENLCPHCGQPCPCHIGNVNGRKAHRNWKEHRQQKSSCNTNKGPPLKGPSHLFIMAALRREMAGGNNPQKIPAETVRIRTGEQCWRALQNSPHPPGSGISFSLNRNYVTSKQTKAQERSSQPQMKSYVVLGPCVETGPYESLPNYSQWPQWATYMNIQAVLSANNRQKVKSFQNTMSRREKIYLDHHSCYGLPGPETSGILKGRLFFPQMAFRIGKSSFVKEQSKGHEQRWYP